MTAATTTEVAEPLTGGFHPLRVTAVERLCDDAVAVTFDVPESLRETYAFRPGQYLTLRKETPDGEERRSYSICAPSGASPRVGVRRVAGGLFSEWLVDGLAAGDEIEVGPPAGSFTPELEAGTHHGLIAAGSGITPVLSIAASLLGAHDDTHVTLLYGNRRTDTVMFTEEIADLKNAYGPRLHLLNVLSREPTEADIFNGRLDADRMRTLLGALVDVEDTDHWWLCGPLGMTDDAVSVLTELGVDRKRVHRELFYVDEPPPELVREDDTAVDGEGSEVTIILNGRSTQLTLPRNVSVLDAAQKVRGDLPFACKGGVCGTCRAKVTDGDVTMRRNFALEDDEVDAGFVLTCQTIPVSDRVVVDFDV
ncbi:1,2-phenylacetyl-CoA epoxidase subunit PaaE [Pseudonocardia abyssalis]|uniref:Phenylacetate-CoA oxygenase/reductase subunit PaaK n=1 Tax=Pseudonocardia abyssalis TaxID=2792008 RepID=A0ABS6USS1_9PSEU|nr:1,2-phenylacetyl-CoA epoxidase subunit PaaE [Pseudonocardia abyssalis]MBW0113716.1 phenylacetate-CoA oxygenase/reductase subunit PaaK [Pseudonocardia abyssalis]MBW0134789.1 phenylacetate-CoA oxygenase/reductase subunit PaaK [Pseudonocardia abyssalis]